MAKDLGSNLQGEKRLYTHNLKCNGCGTNPINHGRFGCRYICITCGKGADGYTDLCVLCGEEYLYN